ncbi:MAG: FAD-dependent oxidoreductase [Planctomycetota bacterium]
MRKHYQVIIVGAGFAGAATAAALATDGVADVLLVDREPTAGAHSSGRNAGMVRRAVENPAITALAVEGASAIVDSGVPLRRTGSYLLGARERISEATLALFPHRWVSAAEARARVPLLGDAIGEEVLETADDGIVEVHALLEHYLSVARNAGVEMCFGAAGVRPRVAGGRVAGLLFEDGREVGCDHLVAATGAWGAEWGEWAGAPVALTPRRRHLICTATLDGGAPPWHWPWVWDLARGYYFRPEAGGLLWSPCDEFPQAACSALPDPAAPRWLAEKLERAMPRAATLQVGQHWAGHRTFAPDGCFLLGPDPRLEGWHWAVGLGGHGVTVSAAIGRRVAGGITGSCAIEAAHAWRSAVVPHEQERRDVVGARGARW